MLIVMSLIGFLLGVSIMSLLLYLLPDDPDTAFVICVIIICVIGLMAWIVNLYLGVPK